MNVAELSPRWKTLSLHDLDALRRARHQAHQAAQLVGLLARALHPPYQNDGNANLDWLGNGATLAGQEVGGRWHTDSWLGVVLLAETLLEQERAEGQAALVAGLFTEGLEAPEAWSVLA